MICNLNNYQPASLDAPAGLTDLLKELPEPVISNYAGFLNSKPEFKETLFRYFSSPEKFPAITPLIIYNEVNHQMVTLLTNRNETPEEPGEPNSILSHVRAYGFDETFLCSDCYGQLSCSSCAIEVLTGDLDNPTPRDEEFDMLDIDEAKPPTEKTRLSCQAQIAKTPLLVKIRAPEKKVLSKV